MSSPRTNRTRVPAAQRREQLLDIAADIVESGGPRALTVDAVVEKADVHRPVVYRHFANADELLDAVVARELTALQDGTQAAVAGVVGLEPRLRAAVGAWLQQFAKQPGLSAVALTRRPDSGVRTERRVGQQRTSMRFLTDEFTAAGLTETDAKVLAAVLLQGLSGIVAMWRRKELTRPQAIDRFVTIATASATAMRGAPLC